MKNIFLTLLFLGFCIFATAQSQPNVGDELVIKEPVAQNYRYVKFPRLNILAKKGKVANYKSVYGNTVIVKEVMTKEDGSTFVLLQKKDGSKFFGYLKNVKANYNKSIEAGELNPSK
ncbi:hypothetical protein [Winogradskyella sp. A2]|uniref:hypothetical protein n=1 Tax=Winogradskyella sp. A2 TaxID=3366944 RepID=UPI00398C5D14